MPELPEVETTRRALAQVLPHGRIERVELGKPLRWPLGVATSALLGRVVRTVRRRGKYLLLDLDGDARPMLLLHLGMSGALRWQALSDGPVGALGPHEHFLMQTSRGALRLHDPRRFGAVVWAQDGADAMACKLLGALGPEPWDERGLPLDAKVFGHRLGQCRGPIKSVLLQGHVVVGVGNIYASEALHLAGIHPALPANRIGPRRARRLRDAIVQVLGQAVALGGSTLRDFHGTDGAAGGYQEQARVYGREGRPCPSCGAGVRRIVQGQRATYYCSVCQKK